LRQQGFKLAVIDTPPAITMAIQSVIALSELIVVPTRLPPHDLRAVGPRSTCANAVPLIFAVNGATPKARITAEAIVALSQHGTVAPVTLHHRTDFAASMIDGRTVMEVDPTGRSAAEIAQLWSYVSERLEKNFRRTVFAVPQPGPAGMAAVRARWGAAAPGRLVRPPRDRLVSEGDPAMTQPETASPRSPDRCWRAALRGLPCAALSRSIGPALMPQLHCRCLKPCRWLKWWRWKRRARTSARSAASDCAASP
jgi:hypothetical protein